MVKLLSLLLGLGFTALLVNCQTTRPAPAVAATVAPAELRNTRWVLRTLNNHAILTPTNGEAFLLLRSEELRAEGNAGCNRFGGTFTAAAPGKLQFGPLHSTRMACLSERDNATERDFLAALATTRTYRISGDTLRLYAENAEHPRAVLHAVYLP